MPVPLRTFTVLLTWCSLASGAFASGAPAGESAGESAVESAVEAGRAIAADRNRGNCFSCHAAAGAEMAGNSGPPLVRMHLRYPDRAELRAQIADPRERNPGTIMPPYGAHGILSERELDLVVEFVYSL